MMRYFQQVLRNQDGTETLSGAFRRPYDDKPRADQLFHATTRAWTLDTQVHDAQLGYRDSEFREVPEAEIRLFLATWFPGEDADRILAAPPPPRSLAPEESRNAE